MATIFDVARVADVSASTVSLAMRGSPKISESTKLLVHAVAAQLNYRPSRIARSLAQQKTNALGVILPSSLNPIYIETNAHIEKEAHKRGYDTYSYFIDEDPQKERRYLEKLYERQVDGLIIVPAYPDVNRDHYLSLAKSHVPIVMRDCIEWLPEVDSVSIDASQGGYMVAKHLLALGHTRIAFVQNDFAIGHRPQRRQGFERALAEQGIEQDATLMRSSGIHLEDGYTVTRSLLAMRERPTAIFYQCDLLAMGGFAAVRDAGLKAPKDISIVGFDDISFAPYLEAPLTTVAHPKEKVAAALLATLLRRIEENDAEPVHLTITPELVVRKSSGPCPGS